MPDKEKPKHGTEVQSKIVYARDEAGVEDKSFPIPVKSFEVTVENEKSGKKEVLKGEHITVNLRADKKDEYITLQTDGLKKNDAFKITVDRNDNDVKVTSYAKDGSSKTINDPELAKKVKAAWDKATALQEGETAPVITGKEAKALAAIVHDAEDAAQKIVGKKPATTQLSK